MISRKPLKLVIQIPSYNESETLPLVLNSIPRNIPGIDQVLVQVVDDGSHDQTTEVALANGADCVIRHKNNRGLSKTFMTGITHALRLGADIIVNTDADNQYPSDEIPRLVAPIAAGQADIVVGDRQPGKNQHFSAFKRLLQVIGSKFISWVSGAEVPDAASGFRAYSRYAALRLQVFNDFSYTLETIIQCNRERIKILYLPIQTNKSIRPSRLHKGIFHFLLKQGGTIIRSVMLYRPITTTLSLGLPVSAVGLFLLLRFLFFYITGNTGVARYSQSVSIGGTLLVFGLLVILVGFLGESMRSGQRMQQEIIVHLRNRTDQSDPQSFTGLDIFTQADKPD